MRPRMPTAREVLDTWKMWDDFVIRNGLEKSSIYIESAVLIRIWWQEFVLENGLQDPIEAIPHIFFGTSLKENSKDALVAFLNRVEQKYPQVMAVQKTLLLWG